jgi:hypothetical protein
MNDRLVFPANADTRFGPIAAIALAVGLALACSIPAARAANEPIPGVDIIVKKNPGGIVATAHADKVGRFTLRLTEPGDYTVTTSGHRKSTCAARSPSIRAPGHPLKPDATGT